MRWILSVLMFAAAIGGATAYYQWDGHAAIPVAVGAIGLVVGCMILAVDAGPSSRPAARRRFTQPTAEWPARAPHDSPDGRLFHRS
jgi:hypothetical protein